MQGFQARLVKSQRTCCCCNQCPCSRSCWNESGQVHTGLSFACPCARFCQDPLRSQSSGTLTHRWPVPTCWRHVQEACLVAGLWNTLRIVLPLLPIISVGHIPELLHRQSIFSNAVAAAMSAVNAAVLYAAVRLVIFIAWVPAAFAWALGQDVWAQTQFKQGGFICWMALAAFALMSPFTMRLVRQAHPLFQARYCVHLPKLLCWNVDGPSACIALS